MRLFMSLFAVFMIIAIVVSSWLILYFERRKDD